MKHTPKKHLIFIFFCVIYAVQLATQATAQPTNVIIHKEYNAVRTATPPRIDGTLDEALWRTHPQQTAEYYTAFEPNNGAPLHQKTLVKLAYDDIGLYIAAKMYDTAPDSIARELGLRDETQKNADDFTFLIDAFNSNQNVFGFTITAAGTQNDTYYTQDNQDPNWNAIWQSAVKIDNDGWTAELFLPYAALRFPKKTEQVWNFNFARGIKRYQEFGFWNPVYKSNPNIAGQFGTLTGISNIKPPLRLSLFPYAAAYQNRSEGTWANRAVVGGLDLKVGLSQSFTLDMALIPDFGQVRSDDIVLNLSPFEVRYQENRPFFTEGTELFGKGNVFYSRRVGEASYEIIDTLRPNEKIIYQPTQTPLINATKISGRTSKGGIGVGFFNAVTNRTYAIAYNDTTQEYRNLLADPLTNYNVTVVDKNLQGGGNIALINTNVYRNNGAKNANVTATQFSVFDKKLKYKLSGDGTISNRFNIGKKNNDLGYRYNINIEEVEGKWQYGATRYVESDNFDPNDLGYLQAPNSIVHRAYVSYNQFTKQGIFNNYNISINTNHEQLYKPQTFTEAGFGLNFNGQLKNYWNVGGGTSGNFGNTYNYFRPRTAGYFFKAPRSQDMYVYMGTNNNKKLSGSMNTGFWRRKKWQQLDNWVGAEVSYRATNKLNFAVGNGWTWTRNERDFVARLYDNNALKNVIFGERTNQNIETNAGAGYTINAKHSINTRLRHYWITVKYDQFFDLDKTTGILKPTDYKGLDDNNAPKHNQNFNVFTYELVYQWQFASASNLSFVYKTNVYTFDKNADISYLNNLQTTLNSPAQGSLSLKVIYFLDYAEWRQKLKKMG
jgi:hypothetical protein